MLKYSYSYWS